MHVLFLADLSLLSFCKAICHIVRKFIAANAGHYFQFAATFSLYALHFVTLIAFFSFLLSFIELEFLNILKP